MNTIVESIYKEVLLEGNSYDIEKKYYLNIVPGLLKRATSVNYFNNKNVLSAQKKLESFNKPVSNFSFRTPTGSTTITAAEVRDYIAGIFREGPRYGISPQDVIVNYKRGIYAATARKSIKVSNITTDILIKFHDWMDKNFIKPGLLLYMTNEEWEAITGKGESAVKKAAKGIYGGLIGFGKSW